MQEETELEQPMNKMTVKHAKKIIQGEVRGKLMAFLDEASDLYLTRAGRALKGEGATPIGGVNRIMADNLIAATFAVWASETGVDDLIRKAHKAGGWEKKSASEAVEDYLPKFVDFAVGAFLDAAQLGDAVTVQHAMFDVNP